MAVLALVALWAALFHLGWATWGNLTIDSGREMYVPSVLAQGKTLYRDVWYLYGPAGPYLNSFLFRLFGIRLEVLYWAGSLSALGCALFLFLVGRHVSASLAGWTAGAVVLVQSFEPGVFSFPLPYSFCAVYGCLVACMFLWFALRALNPPGGRVWIFAAGFAAAAAMLLKLEYGAACYVTLAILIAVRSFPRHRRGTLSRDLLAVLPGIVGTVAVAAWMISLRGVSFITQENFMSWPTSWFMKTYGRRWLQNTGFGMSPVLAADAAIHVTGFALAVLGFWQLLRWTRQRKGLRLVAFAILGGAFGYVWNIRPFLADELARLIFFPKEMVLFVAIAGGFSWWFFLRRRSAECSPTIPILFLFSSLLAFRVLLGTQPFRYAIYYDGPAVLSYLVLATFLVSRTNRCRRSLFRWKLLICIGCLAAVSLHAGIVAVGTEDLVPLVTRRGTMRVTPRMAEAYRTAIAFMREKAARGESVLSIPEDTSLYFLSGTYCPTRVFAFTPGLVAPGKMTNELIQELERRHPRYLLWSNREYQEYGVPVFGRDFDRVLGDYFRSHYHPVRPLIPGNGCGWSAVIWELNAEDGSR